MRPLLFSPSITHEYVLEQFLQKQEKFVDQVTLDGYIKSEFTGFATAEDSLTANLQQHRQCAFGSSVEIRTFAGKIITGTS